MIALVVCEEEREGSREIARESFAVGAGDGEDLGGRDEGVDGVAEFGGKGEECCCWSWLLLGGKRGECHVVVMCTRSIFVVVLVSFRREGRPRSDSSYALDLWCYCQHELNLLRPLVDQNSPCLRMVSSFADSHTCAEMSTGF